MLYKSIALPIELRRPEWADIIIIFALFGQRACSLQTKKYSIFGCYSSNKSKIHLVTTDILLYNWPMDIPVSRLNKRMALQLPAELPLGLVFVVGKVRNLASTEGEGGRPFFYISENEHMLRCQLSERALEGVNINEGDMIRAGGHLAFDTLQADYFLLARDIEILPEHRPSRTTLAPILADIKKRSQAASLVPAELPDWVQQIAPPELRGTAATPIVQEGTVDGAGLTLQETVVLETAAEPEPEPAAEEPSQEMLQQPVAESLPEGFTDDLVHFLSEAMDSPDEVELTQELVAELAPAIRPEQPRFKAAQPYDVTNVKTDKQVPWAIVLIVLFFLASFLGLILFLAIIAAT